MTRNLLRGAALAAALFSSAADAHVTLERNEADVGTFYKAVLKVGHGCGAAPTTGLKVTIPEGVVSVKPMPKPGWTIATETGTYARAYAFHGKEVREGVTAVSWTGGSLPDSQYDEFVFMAYLPAEAGARSVPLTVVQTCAAGENRWVEVASTPGEKPAFPAPVLKVSASQDVAKTDVFEAGPLRVEGAWSRATPGGAQVAGGFLRITNTGATPDRLLGGSFARAGDVQVHEVAVRDGIVTMRQVTGGLEIPPGGSIELAPGGDHLMFTDLSAPLKEGESISGTLRFEKAGPVNVTYTVRGIGAKGRDPAPPMAGHQH